MQSYKIVIMGICFLVWAVIWNRLQKTAAFTGSTSTGAAPAFIGILLLVASTVN